MRSYYLLTDTLLELLHLDRHAQPINILGRSTEGMWGDVVCMWVCVLFIRLCVLVWMLRRWVFVQESAELTELETSDRAEEHVVHIWSVHTYTHTSKVSWIENICHWICWRLIFTGCFSYSLYLQVLKYLDYVFTGVFTFEMVIKVRRLDGHFHFHGSVTHCVSLCC